MPKVARDSVTGEFVTMEYARAHPETTQVETVPEHVAREAPAAAVEPDPPAPPAVTGDTDGANTTSTTDRPW